MKGDSVPKSDSVIRHVSITKMTGSKVKREAFESPTLSVNWLQCREGTEEQQIQRVRELVRRKLKPTEKLAELSVESICSLSNEIDVIKAPLCASCNWPEAPCHAEITGLPEEHEERQILNTLLAANVQYLHPTYSENE